MHHLFFNIEQERTYYIYMLHVENMYHDFCTVLTTKCGQEFKQFVSEFKKLCSDTRKKHNDFYPIQEYCAEGKYIVLVSKYDLSRNEIIESWYKKKYIHKTVTTLGCYLFNQLNLIWWTEIEKKSCISFEDCVRPFN